MTSWEGGTCPEDSVRYQEERGGRKQRERSWGRGGGSKDWKMLRGLWIFFFKEESAREPQSLLPCLCQHSCPSLLLLHPKLHRLILAKGPPFSCILLGSAQGSFQPSHSHPSIRCHRGYLHVSTLSHVTPQIANGILQSHLPLSG